MVADRDVRHENCSSKNGDQKLTTIFVYGLTPLHSFFDGPGGTPAFYPYLTPPPPPGAPSVAVARLLWTRPFLPTFVVILTAHIVQKTTSI